MPARDDRALDSLISGSEELIRELVDTGIPEADAARFAADIEENIQKQELAELDALTDPQSDARVEVSVSDDEMAARATFHPPTGDRPPLDIDAVHAALDTKKVSAGIDWNAIKTAVLTCNTERIRLDDVVVARGTKPVDDLPPYLVVSSALLESKRKQESPAGRIDFRELSPYTLVRKGDVLATLTPRRSGETGSTVRGAAIAYSKGAAPVLTPGRNTLVQEGTILAACDGRFELTEDGFRVDEVLDVPGDVDYHTGNIDFPGDVMIAGEIRDGFKVNAGGSLFCIKSIDASQIACKGDLITNQGIIGRKQAVIRVGGILRARFVEGCYIEAGDSIYVQTSILNSSVHSRNRVEMGDRGIIVGGIIYAQNGVSAAQIGTDRSSRTEIHCGIDHTVEQKLLWIRDKNIALAMKLKEIEEKMKSSPDARAKLAELQGRIKKAIHQMNESARALVQKLDRNEKAEVSVREAVFPGTYIEICHVSYLVTKPTKYVTFRLGKAEGKIIETKWEKRARE